MWFHNRAGVSISIRTRLIIVLTLGMGGLFIIYGFVFSLMTRKLFLDRFDESVLDDSELLISLTKNRVQGVMVDFSEDIIPDYSAPDGPNYFEIWLPDGRLLARSRSLGDRHLMDAYTFFDDPEFRDIQLEPGGHCRMVQLSFLPKSEVPDLRSILHPTGKREDAVTLVLAASRADLDRLLQIIGWMSLVALVTLLCAMFLIVRAALNHCLKPLEDIRRQVGQMGPNRLQHPIILDPPVTELSPIVIQLNDLLRQLEQALGRERRFTSDVAHELGTPLAELTSLAEIGGKWPENRQMVEGFFKDVGDIAAHLQGIVANLLGLARCDMGTQKVVKESLALQPIWKHVIQRAQPATKTRHLHWEGSVPSDLRLEADPVMIDLILQNLANNAADYCPVGGVIRYGLATQDTYVCLWIENPCLHLKSQDLDHLFERFWRKDSARSGGQHAGLGLALVQSFCDLLGWEIRASLSDTNYLRMELKMPLEVTV